ncbi:condensin complex subunit 1-like isoform X2 [Penaeus chinensis]|uniref:condensin complex subunit 1-like isoform X2 n=1 Tax=Penaeus chinensis TaxID=139456 RepID=UPI001FB6BE8D|nr:condensin complex subunit 1-like isoform X2 [Penaeus chinensis]
MDTFDFVIPLSLDALQESTSTRQYVVYNISTSKEIPKKIQEAQVAFRQDGPHFIIKAQNFDVLYSVLVSFGSVDGEFRQRSWELLLKAMSKVTAELALLLDEGDLSAKERHQWLNVLKMTTYIACNLTESFENEYNKPSTDTLVLGKQGRKKSARKSDDGTDWEEERNRMLVQLFSVLQHPLHRLWEPPIMEEDFVNLIANCCYKILESPTMNLARTKSTRDSIFQIIGTLVKKFNHGLACSLKLMQLLQHFEHMVVPCAQGVILLIESFGNTTVVSEMVREIAKVDARELMKDTSGLRNFSQFLVEVSEKCPQVMLPSLSLLVNFLHEEASGMRNCVLSILGSIVLRVLSSEQLDPKSRDLRDQCLDHLEDHIHDIHAFVRSKVLHIWNGLVSEKAVPLRRQQQVLKLTLGRLKDKSSHVRKSAVQLLTAFLKGNPFAAKLPLEELEGQHEEELKKLKEMDPKAALDLSAEEENKPQVEKTVTGRELWAAMLPEVVAIVLEVVDEGGTEDDDDDEDSLEEDASLNDAVLEIAEALNSSKIRRAVKLLECALEMFHGAEVFGYDPEIHSSKAYKKLSKDEELTDHQIRHLVVLERIFLSAKEMEESKNRPAEEEKMDEDKKPEEEGEEEKEETEEMRAEKEAQAEVTKQKLLVNYLKDSVCFAKLFNKGLPVLCQLLSSKHVSDVLEAVQFFVTAFEFGLLNAMTGVRRMLALVWSKEQAVKDAVIGAYQRLYINIEAPNERARAQHIVRNLSALITGATLGERTSMEEIIAQFVNSGDITKQCLTLLWERFTKTLPDTTDDESLAGLVLLAMCANSEAHIVSSNIGVLVNSGLGERGLHNFTLVKETCTALLKLSPAKPKTDDPNPPNRFNRDHEIFERLTKILLEGLNILEDRQYSPMAVEAVSLIYSLAEHPDLICGEILQEMSKIMLSHHTEAADSASDGSQPETEDIKVPVGILTRFFVFVGQVALRQLIHLDTYVFSELKRRNYLKEEMETEKKKKKKKRNIRKSLATSATEASMIRGGSQDGDMDEEMGLTGAVADDMEAEYIRSICETEIVKADNLLALVKPVILAVCTNPAKYADAELRTASTLALAKFMMISSDLCEDNLQLLFTILEKSEDHAIRANIVIALGDLSFRFPNQLEPWTPRIYARLRDGSPKVRQNTLTILTHLILNDMVKVKGQISDIALCITDDDPRISGLAKLFFSELARKGNALYNVLPDIISRLSDTELGIEEKRYRTIIGHILNLVQKDKQLETLVEKLCHRFQATVTTRQWRDISYCLSLFSYNEKSIRKLSENFSCYADKLFEPEVYEFFLGILASARKLVKPEMKVLIEELESRMQESHEKGVEDENVLNKAASAKTKAKNVKNSEKGAKGRIRGRRRKESSSEDEEKTEEEEEEDEGEEEEEAEETRSQLHPAHRQNKENQRMTRRSGNMEKPHKKKVTISTDSDEDDSKVSTPPKRKSGRMSHVKPLSENSSRLSRSSRRK